MGHGYRETRRTYWKNGERHVEIVREELSPEETDALIGMSEGLQHHAEEMVKQMESLFSQMNGFFQGMDAVFRKTGRRDPKR